MFNALNFMYDITSRLISYMKYNGGDFINKEIIIKMRDNFPLEYKAACKFYNSKNVKKFMKYSKIVLERDYEKILDNEDNEDNEKVIKNQHSSLVRAINDSFENLNLETIVKIINSIKDDSDSNKYNLQLIIKGLIILQILYNIRNIIDTTIKNNGSYDDLSEYNNNLYFKLLEHMNEYDYLINNNKILSESSKEIDIDDEDDNENTINVEKFYNDDLFKNDASINPFNDDEDDNDLDTIIGNDDEFYSASNIDKYIYELYYKEIILIQSIIELIISNDYKLIPSNNYIMYWLIILTLHITNKF